MNDRQTLIEIGELINKALYQNKVETAVKVSHLGGKEIKKYSNYLDSQAETGDKHWIKLAKELPRYVIVNDNLTDKQLMNDSFSFYYNNNYYFMSNTLEVKSYNPDFPPAAMIVDYAKNATNGNIKNHLVACARNASFPTHSDYQKYLDAVEESCIRFANREYKLLADRDALQLK